MKLCVLLRILFDKAFGAWRTTRQRSRKRQFDIHLYGNQFGELTNKQWYQLEQLTGIFLRRHFFVYFCGTSQTHTISFHHELHSSPYQRFFEQQKPQRL